MIKLGLKMSSNVRETHTRALFVIDHRTPSFQNHLNSQGSIIYSSAAMVINLNSHCPTRCWVDGLHMSKVSCSRVTLQRLLHEARYEHGMGPRGPNTLANKYVHDKAAHNSGYTRLQNRYSPVTWWLLAKRIAAFDESYLGHLLNIEL